MNEHREQDAPSELSNASEQASETPRRTRILALIGAIFVIALTILYAYSVATGKIFAW